MGDKFRITFDKPYYDPTYFMITTDRNHPDLNQPGENGQNKAYLVMSEAEIGKGFTRPFRDSYVHKVENCGHVTTMGRALSETYAANPKFYGATYCSHCRTHFPVAEFNWIEMDGKEGPVVGS